MSAYFVNPNICSSYSSHNSTVRVTVTLQFSNLVHNPLVEGIFRLFCSTDQTIHWQDECVFDRTHLLRHIIDIFTEKIWLIVLFFLLSFLCNSSGRWNPLLDGCTSLSGRVLLYSLQRHLSSVLMLSVLDKGLDCETVGSAYIPHFWFGVHHWNIFYDSLF